MLPSKIKPTASPFVLIIAEPELPPIISLVDTKFSGLLYNSAGGFNHLSGKLQGAFWP